MTHDRHSNPNPSERKPSERKPSERNLDAELPFDWGKLSELDRRRPDPELIDIGALIDEELSSEARARVEARLSANADSQRTYQQLARLSRELKQIPIPASTISPEELAHRTIAAAQDRKQQQRRRWSSWGGTAIAALFVATVSFSSNLRPEHQTPEIAATPTPTTDVKSSTPANSIAKDNVNAIDAIDTESPLISRALFVE
jgi:hypothetical protein